MPCGYKRSTPSGIAPALPDAQSEGMSRPALLALAAALAASACIDTRIEQRSSNVVDIRADTTLVGRITFQLGNGFDPQAPGGSDVVTYRNTTSRTFSRLSIAISENLTQSQQTCVPLRPVLSDTVLTNVPPDRSVTLLTGILPSSLRIYVTEATEGSTRLVNELAGRWQGTYSEWRGTTRRNREAVAVSQSGGRISLRAIDAGDTLVFESQLGLPRPLGYSAYPNSCDGLYQGDPGAADSRFALAGDSLVLFARALPTASTTVTIPDSFAIRLTRRP